MDHVGFEYRNQEGNTVFETFLKYSNEKKESAMMLSEILDEVLTGDEVDLLDVGSGNGEYLKLALQKMKIHKEMRLSLLEPSQDLIDQLHCTAQVFPSEYIVRIIHSTFEGFTSSDRFDLVLVSHVPLAKDQKEKMPMILERLLSYLKPYGHMVIVLRERDDVHEFRNVFKSRIMGINYQSIVIDDVVNMFMDLSTKIPLQISRFSKDAQLHIPYLTNVKDTIKIIEFFLNRKWIQIPQSIRNDILYHIHSKEGLFHLRDGFVVVRTC